MENEFNRRHFLRYASIAGTGLAAGIPKIVCGSGDIGTKTAISGGTAFGSDTPWRPRDLRQAVLDRVAHEKSRSELNVYYYRIGHTISFRLPVAARPGHTDLPVGIAGGAYPWLTWLSWDLESRWRSLHMAWRHDKDSKAGMLLQQEMAALAGWDRFIEGSSNQVSLVTAHIAASFSLVLADTTGWDAELLQQTRLAATALVERDAWPWFLKHWNNSEKFTPPQLHNIPVIILARSAQLARLLNSPHAEVMERKMVDVLHTWCRYRTGEEFHTEGTAYDGYLMDHITGWMADLPFRAELLRQYQDTFRSLADQWIDLTLPGQPDLHAPIGDVEPEMTFWCTVLVRLAVWYGWHDAAWLLVRIPLDRLPVASISVAREHAGIFGSGLMAPTTAPREHPGSVSLRTGWSAPDLAVVLSIPRNRMSHLHRDCGHLVVGWQRRFWITDPGYQQYRPGEERDYTIGTAAHNCPVIDGRAQKVPACRLLGVDTDEYGWRHTGIDITRCYEGLPADASVHRDAWHAPGAERMVVVRDRFHSLRPDTGIQTHWIGDTDLAWSFTEGWARLSDGSSALWLGTVSDPFVPSGLTRHPGSRGPLTLTHTARLNAGTGVRWWVFWCDPECGWSPPVITQDGERLVVHVARIGTNRSFGG